jgi:hypothetical protein
VDQEDQLVYVINNVESNGAVLRFDAEGTPVPFEGAAPYLSGNELAGLSFAGCLGCSQVSVNPVTHDFYVTSGNSVTAFHQNGEPAEFTAGPDAGTNTLTGFTALFGVAVDANGAIYASDFGVFGEAGSDSVTVYTTEGEALTMFSPGIGNPGTLAVDGKGTVYLSEWANPVWKLTPSEFPVTSSTTYVVAPMPIDPNRAATVAVDPVTNDVYVDRYSPQAEIAWYDAQGTLLRTFAGPDEEGELSSSEGIAILGNEEKVFISNVVAIGLSQVEVFWEDNSEGPPRVAQVSAADVTAESARLSAAINPRRVETTYRFEYGLSDCAVSTCSSIPIPNASIGDGHKSVNVSQALLGLQPDTTYHYRVVAENALGDNLAAEGDHTFRTQPADLGFKLSDLRAWEMVSPPDKRGALLDGSLNAQVQAAADGSALSYPGRGSVVADPDGSRAVEASTVLSRRIGNGWQSEEISLPNDTVTEIGIGVQGEYKLFNDDLSEALIEPRTAYPLSPDASQRTPYVRENTAPPSYTPLLTEANVPPDTEFGGAPGEGADPVDLVGANADFSRLVLASRVPLVEEAPPGVGLYLWNSGQIDALGVLPAGEGGGIVPALLGSNKVSVEHAVSDDGSRVFWSAASLDALYLRDVEGEEGVRLDVPQGGGTGTGEAKPTFQGASADGSVVFFTDSQQLTADASPTGFNQFDLYRCVLPVGPVGGCTSLVDISAPLSGSEESAKVQGATVGISDDGSLAYFVARGVLDTAANAAGDTAVPNRPNLYLWQEGDGVRFIATLSKEDGTDWGGAAGKSAATSPSGRYLSFMSQLPLSGSSNLDAETGEPLEHVFRYDAVLDRLDCLSCDPTGAVSDGEKVGGLRLVDPRLQWTGKRVAAVLPQPTITALEGVSLYAPRAVLDNGRVFFNAFDSLVPADSNGGWDVYQFEPYGTGNCSESSGGAATAKTSGGCVSIMSSGTGEGEVGFLDASETGDDVFFLTKARLNAIDEDSELDVYDARVNGVPAVPPSRSECLGESCQPFSPPPIDPTPGSASFKGPGNVKAHKHCPSGKRKVKRKGKVRCVPRKHRKRSASVKGGRR